MEGKMKKCKSRKVERWMSGKMGELKIDEWMS